MLRSLYKNVARNHVIAAGCMNPALAGCMPVEQIDRVYINNEIRPSRRLFMQVNEWLRGDLRVGWKEPIGVPS